MIRWLLAATLCTLLPAGCSDARKPTVQRRVIEPESGTAGREDAIGLFHPTPRGEKLAETRGPEVDLGTVRLTAPESWIRKQPRSGFTLAEFSLPRAEGDAADGRLTVTAVGGSVEANVGRWRQQFAGKPEAESQEQIEIAGVRVTLVDFSGTYVDQRGGFAGAVECPGYRMRAAIFSLRGQQYIIKCYGPRRTMADRADEFLAFVRSLKPTQPGSAEADFTAPKPTELQSTEMDFTEPKAAEAAHVALA